MKKIITLMLCVTVFFSMANAKNIFVDPTIGVDAAGKGASWEAAVKTFAGAVNVTYTSFAAGDNIYVKGGTLTYSAAFTSNATANYYGSCDLSNTGTSTTRTVIDKDGNGIIEPWEFQNQTVLYSTASIASGGTGNVTAFTLGASGYTFDGFTITHVGTNASTTTTVYLRSININPGAIFKNNSMKYSVVTFTPSNSTSLPYEMFFRTANGVVTTVSNCLFEKNSITYNTTTTNAAYPFIGISSTNFSNCTVRNNLVTVNATAANQVRGMLIGIAPSVSPFPSLRNCLIHNNEMVYNGTGGTTSNVGATVNVYSNDGNDSIVNCTIANNKSTNVPLAGVQTPSRSTTTNIIQNNVLWNNTSGASTVANITINSTTSASSSVTKNFSNAGQTVTENGTTITGNNFTLSSVNDTGNQPLFKSPVINTKVGSSLITLTATDSTTIKQSNWKLQSSSYLINKGIYLPNSPTGVSPMDKDGKYFATSPTLPAIGAYDYVTTPVITFTQDLSTLKLGDSPVTLTAGSSAVTNAATITFTSSNSSVVSVSGSTLTVIGPGIATVTAQQGGNAYYEPAANVAQNVTVSIINAGFEDVVNGYTVTENSLNVLRRVSGIQDVTTQTASPTTTATSITSGMWVKKAPSTAYIKGVVTTTDKHSGNSSLNFYISAGTPNTGYDNWVGNLVLQKFNLTNTQKYTVSFWARVDPTASNVASTVTVFITDNTKKTNLSCAIPLTGGTTWTLYSATFDIPTFKAANATADFTTAFVGVGLTTTYNANTLKTNYSGVLLDDFTITPTTASTVVISTSGTNGSVTGGSAYTVGSSATVVAAPNNGYKFVNWTESGTEVSTSASYNFTVSAARTLVANFTATTTTCTITPASLTGFTYTNGFGPSAEQTFTVSGTNLTSNVAISPATDYEISTASGVSFAATNPILLTNSGGTLSSTTIYVRMKAGLAVNSYNSNENINISVLTLANQSVACSGSVFSNPILTFATPTSVSKTYGDAVFTNAASSTAGSAGAITYSSGNLGVASVDANTGQITISGAGSSVITASIAANGSYGVATATYTLNVAKATPTISVSGSQSYTFTGLEQGPATINYNGDGSTSLLYSNVGGTAYSSATAPINAGTYQVVASATAGTNYVAASSAAYTFTIYSNGNISSDTNVSSMTLSAASNLSVAAGNTLTIDAATNVNSVSVAPGARLTLNAGQSLSTASLTLQSDASGTATFVDNTSNGGLTVSATTTVQQYLSTSRNWYLTTPLTGSTAAVVNPQGSSNLLYWYDETKGAPTGWSTITTNSTPLIPVLGYIVKPASDGVTLNFTGGSLNTGTNPNMTLYRTSAPDHAGFNLIGNPYPSYLNAKTLINSSPNLDKSIWYRTQIKNSETYKFDTYNTASGQYINASGNTSFIVGTVPPLQAFWVRVSSGQSSASLNFSNSYRTHAVADTTNPLKVKNQIALAQPSLRLQVSNGVNSDETLIYSDPAAMNGYDIYDSQKMSNGSASIPELFTFADNQQLAINGVNQITYNTEMPLGFTTLSAGNFSIKASLIANLVTGAQVILKDYQDTNNPVITDLSDGNSYLFSSSVTTNNSSRFALIFKAPSVTTGINPAESGDVWISTRNGQIIINGVNANGARLEVYNAVGQKVFLGNLTSSNTPLNTKFAAGTYLVKLSSNGYSLTKKIVID